MARVLRDSRPMRSTWTRFSFALVISCAACSAPSDDPGDGEHDAFPSGKADGGIDPGSPQAAAVLAVVNDPAVDFEILDDDARLDRRAAAGIIEHRAGPDEVYETPDDDAFDDLAELDAIRYVGPAALRRLLEYAEANGYLQPDVAQATSVIFSPQPFAQSHNARVAELIDGAQDTLDIAMYSFRDSGVFDALERANDRGVEIRFVFETANADRKLDGTDLLDSRSGALEQLGIDVRYVNKIMHHKFVIVDGPRDDLAAADTATVATGSANWSFSAATRYDENTLFLTGHRELNLRLQQEFDHMWSHSRDFVAGTPLPQTMAGVTITDADIVDEPDTDVLFTSDNFDISGDTTFRITARSTVSDAMVAAIEDATDSILIASGHLRSRPISEALMAKAQQNPNMDIRVYLDGQEFISAATHAIQLEDLDECLADASTASQTRKCMNKGFRFGFIVGESGAEVRYKHYAFRWHYTYAEQMHHKYMVIDGDELWTGSYNLSDNAEHHTFENMMVFRGPQFAELVGAYVGNFESIWNTGRSGGLLAELRDEIATAADIPIVYEPMALQWQEVSDLKGLIRDNCSVINTTEFRIHPQSHFTCPRD